MTKFIINGKNPINGTVTVSGSKHAAISMIMGAMLTDEEVIINNVPDILDVHYATSYVRTRGYNVDWINKNRVRIIKRHSSFWPSFSATQFRYSLLDLGIQLARTGNVKIILPGGCKLGKRAHNFHVDGLAKMGADLDNIGSAGITGYAKLWGSDIILPYPSVSATLNLICAASLANGKTTIDGAARNPEVQDFIYFLRQMGAEVEWTNERLLSIRGVRELHGTKYTVMGDRIEALTFIIATAIAGGDVQVERCRQRTIRAEIRKLMEIGVDIISTGNGIRVRNSNKAPYHPVLISTSAYPGFHTDVQPLITALLATVPGRSYVSEWINNDRFRYVDGLNNMGANIKIINEDWSCVNGENGQRLFFDGTKLHGALVQAPDLRGGAALVLAALGAEGQTVISNAEQIDRGYEWIDEKLRSLGADIRREG